MARGVNSANLLPSTGVDLGKVSISSYLGVNTFNCYLFKGKLGENLF